MGKAKRDGVWTHEGVDVKADPAVAEGINVLPDGNVALSKRFLKDSVRLRRIRPWPAWARRDARATGRRRVLEDDQPVRPGVGQLAARSRASRG